MAYPIGSMVLYGELRNTHRNSVFGTLVTRGRARPITFRLAGNCAPALRGRHVVFGTPEREDSRPEDMDLSPLASEQCGPLGVGTVLRRARPPARGAGCEDVLLLEWFGQNGIVVVEIPGVTLEECSELAAGRGPSAIAGGVLADEDAGRRAFASDVARRLDERARARILRPVTTDDLHRFDFEPCTDVDFTSIFDEPLEYRAPESLHGEEADYELTRLLLQLAYRGFAVDLCEHASSREVYRYLVEEVVPSKGGFSRETFLNATTHYSFYERCPSCQREFDECFV